MRCAEDYGPWNTVSSPTPVRGCVFHRNKKSFQRGQGIRHGIAHHATEQSLATPDRKSTRLNSSHLVISYAVFCLKKKIVFPDQVTEPHPLSSAARTRPSAGSS